MKIRELIERFSAGVNHSYSGNSDSEFFGLHLVALPTVNSRIFVLVDANWPRGPQRMFSSPRKSSPAVRIKTAFKNGATAAVVPRSLHSPEVSKELEGQNFFLVDDTFSFTAEINRVIRAKFSAQYLTAITGAAGKSTTKGMLAHALRSIEVHPEAVLAPEGNQNLYWSTVWMASRLEQHNHIVAEVASSACTIFRKYKAPLASDVAIITSISEAHVQGKEGLREIAIRKAALFDGSPPGGTAVINLDTPYARLLVRYAIRAGRQVITYGESPGAAIRLVSYDLASRRVEVRIGSEELTYTIGAPGKHMALNSLAVVATLRSYRIGNWRRALDSLADFEAIAGRGKVIRTSFGRGAEVTLIDESFNANPVSMRASLDAFQGHEVPGGGRRIALLGDMLELGSHSTSAHAALAEVALASDLDLLIIFGAEMGALRDALNDAGSTMFVYFESFDEMKTALPDLLHLGDLILAKASGATGLKDWVRSLTPSE